MFYVTNYVNMELWIWRYYLILLLRTVCNFLILQCRGPVWMNTVFSGYLITSLPVSSASRHQLFVSTGTMFLWVSIKLQHLLRTQVLLLGYSNWSIQQFQLFFIHSNVPTAADETLWKYKFMRNYGQAHPCCCPTNDESCSWKRYYCY